MDKTHSLNRGLYQVNEVNNIYTAQYDLLYIKQYERKQSKTLYFIYESMKLKNNTVVDKSQNLSLHQQGTLIT